jgi:hypothetical protein
LKFGSENVKGREHLEDLGVNGRKIFKSTLKVWDGNLGTGFVWLRIGINSGLL